MSLTPAQIPEMEEGQLQKEVTYNEAMAQIGAFFSGVLSASTTAPPASPANGDAYLIPSGATGLWAGQEDYFAFYMSGWRYVAPFEGILLWVQDDQQYWHYETGSGWGSYNPGAGVLGPGSSVSGNLAAFANNDGDQIEDSGLAPSTDGTLASNSDAKLPTEKAVKTYVDGILAAADALVYKGVIDASTNPNYPAANAGWTYKISVAGKIGGGSGINVQAGDMAICTVDGSASGNEATVGANWNVIHVNIDGAVIGPASVTSGLVALFDGTTGKLIKAGTLTDVLDLVGSAAQGDILYRGASGWARLPAGTADYFLQTKGAGQNPVWAVGGGGGSSIYSRGATWYNSGDALVAADANIVYVRCPVGGTITKGYVLTEGGPGSCEVEIWKDTFANYPPTNADKISGSTPLTISSGNASEDSTLTGWSLSVTAGDIIAFKLNTTSTFTMISANLEITP